MSTIQYSNSSCCRLGSLLYSSRGAANR